MFANLVLLSKVSAVTMQNEVHACRRVSAMTAIVGNTDANQFFPQNNGHLVLMGSGIMFFFYCWKRMLHWSFILLCLRIKFPSFCSCLLSIFFPFSSITIFGTGAKWLSVLQERNLKPGELWSRSQMCARLHDVHAHRHPQTHMDAHK